MNHQKKRTSEHIWQPEKKMVTGSRPILFFIMPIIWVQNQKWSKIFCEFLIILFQKSLLDILTKLRKLTIFTISNRGRGLAFGAHFQ